MKKTCPIGGEVFEVTDDDLKFYDAISPVIAGRKYALSSPSLCPEHRRQRRLSFRNERSLYRRQCDKCHKNLMSVYSKDKHFTVYCKDCWWSDSWDPMSFGRDFDFNRPFFEQFEKLMKVVPRLSIINFNDENSDYTNYGFGNKDCYLMSTSDRDEKCYYACYVQSSFQCIDNFSLLESQHCYQCVDSDTLYECQYCRGCISCQNCFGCIESKNLKNCFGCVGLQNKEYCFFNEQLSKDEYLKKVSEALLDRDGILSKIAEFSKSFPKRAVFQLNSEASVGDHFKNCKNAFMAFDGFGAEESKYLTNFQGGINHCYDFDGVANVEWAAEGISSGFATNQCFSIDHNWKGANEVYYSSYCSVNSQLFGCIGLRKKKYCVLNKQYTKEEYEELLPKIIEHMRKTGEWGEFFPMHISPFGYNETAAHAEYPLSREEALSKGLKWKDEEREILKVEKIIPGEKLPKDISKIPNDILNWAIECEVTKKPFKIIPQELEFYRLFTIPVPTMHPDERHRQRVLLRNPRKLWERACDKCQKKVMTSYSPERAEKIYCEECYSKELS